MPLLFELTIVIVTGLALGSFATALIYRVPRKYSWIANGEERTQKSGNKEISPYRSVCPECRTPLTPRDLVPLFSWALSKGRCRHCDAKIAPVYPLTEFATLLASLGVYLSFGLTAPAVFMFMVLPFLMALLVIDLKYMILPNSLVFIVAFIGVLRLVFEGLVFETINPALIGMNYVLGAFLYTGLAFFIGRALSFFLKKDALGFGDIKFFAAAGLWLGIANLSLFCIFSGAIGIVFSLFWKKFRKQHIFPFGPSLITALYVLLLLEGSLFH